MAPRGRKRGGGGRNANPAVGAARMLDKQIARAEAKATALDAQAAAQRGSIEPLKAAREALGDVGDASAASAQAAASPNK